MCEHDNYIHHTSYGDRLHKFRCHCNPPCPLQTLFSIEQQTGRVRLEGGLDYDDPETRQHTITIVASVMPAPYRVHSGQFTPSLSFEGHACMYMYMYVAQHSEIEV